MKRSPVVWILVLLALIIVGAVFLMAGKQSATNPASGTRATSVPADNLPTRNVRDIIQPGQPIGNDATTSTSTP